MAETRHKGYIGVGETSASQVITDVYYFAVDSFAWKVDPTINKASLAMGSRAVQRETLTALRAPGSFTFEANPENLGRILKWSLRTATPGVVDNSDTSFKHTFEPENTLKPFYIREVKGGADDIIIGPCKIDTLALAATAGEKLMATVEFLTSGDGYEDAAAHGAASFPDVQLKPFIFKQLADKLDDHSTWPPTTADTTWESFNLLINNNLDGDKFTSNGKLYPSELPEGERMISGEFKREFASSVLWKKFLAETEQMFLAEFTAGLIAGANYYFLNLNMYRAYLIDHDRGGDMGGGGGRFVATIPFDLLYDTTKLMELAIDLQNMTATY